MQSEVAVVPCRLHLTYPAGERQVFRVAKAHPRQARLEAVCLFVQV
jgi:hypothetical protein